MIPSARAGQPLCFRGHRCDEPLSLRSLRRRPPALRLHNELSSIQRFPDATGAAQATRSWSSTRLRQFCHPPDHTGYPLPEAQAAYGSERSNSTRIASGHRHFEALSERNYRRFTMPATAGLLMSGAIGRTLASSYLSMIDVVYCQTLLIFGRLVLTHHQRSTSPGQRGLRGRPDGRHRDSYRTWLSSRRRTQRQARDLYANAGRDIQPP
jgi:hypothetical protein